MDSSGNFAPEGMVVTQNHLASQSALKILRSGGTAIEAMIAAAATTAVVDPTSSTIGGDSFWLIIPPNGEPIVIEACGQAGEKVSKEFFKGMDSIPFNGPKAAITVAGTVGGWQHALDYLKESGYEPQSVKDLLADAVQYAENGFPLSETHIFELECQKSSGKLTDDVLRYFTNNGTIPKFCEKLKQPELAETLKYLSENGLNSFYEGHLAQKIAKDMEKRGAPITERDLKMYKPRRSKPLHLQHSFGHLYNTGPPTQGLVSLSLLSVLDHLKINGNDESGFIHSCVEGIKQAFLMRDEYITDPRYMHQEPKSLISPENIKKMAEKISYSASPIRNGKGPGDTVWMGCMDNKGFSVSFIQSVYHIFGSGIVLPTTGILWHNRGTAFSLDEKSILFIEPGKLPYHTLNPAAAILNDGRVIVYGSQGGDGQPQFQAAVFHRYVVQDMPLQKSVTAPRWVFGRLSGNHSSLLRIENRFPKHVIEDLKSRGHKIVLEESFSKDMGYAGIIVRHPNGILEGAFDPRSEGSAVGF